MVLEPWSVTRSLWDPSSSVRRAQTAQRSEAAK